MENENNYSKSNRLYMLGAMYVIAAYTFIFLSAGVDKMELSESLLSLQNILKWLLGFLPFILGIINFIVMFTGGKKYDRNTLLNCVVLIKYSLIPFYIIGGGVILLFLLLTFIPVPVMIFVGPTVAFVLYIVGWLILVGAAPFSIVYIVKSYKEGVHGKILSVVSGILQFFFVFDVISVMILALKERRWRKLTIAIIVLLMALCIVCMIGIVMLIVHYK